MILKQEVYSDTGNYLKQWSDKDVYIKNKHDELFDIAYDFLELSAQAIYEETDIPIDVSINCI